jgi:hypothetical protein
MKLHSELEDMELEASVTEATSVTQRLREIKDPHLMFPFLEDQVFQSRFGFDYENGLVIWDNTSSRQMFTIFLYSSVTRTCLSVFSPK